MNEHKIEKYISKVLETHLFESRKFEQFKCIYTDECSSNNLKFVKVYLSQDTEIELSISVYFTDDKEKAVVLAKLELSYLLKLISFELYIHFYNKLLKK